MKLRKTGLWLLAALAIMVLCTAGCAFAEGPTAPNRDAVLQHERIANQLLNGSARNGWYSWDETILHIDAQEDPTLNGTGTWSIVCNGEVRAMSISLMMQDYSEEYTTVYSQHYERKVSSYTTCEIVTEGNYELTVFVTLTNGENYYDNDRFTVGDAETSTLMKKVAALAAEAGRETDGTPWAKALYLHDWLTNHAYYDLNYEYYGADGVLLRGYGVCDSYSKAYLMLCKAAGIEVRRVTGWAGESHAWNAIQIDEDWYYVDVTWDDPSGVAEAVSGSERHDYFCLNDELMSLDHTKDTTGEGAFSESCTSLDANWALRMSPDTWSSWEDWNELGNNIVTIENGSLKSVEQYSGQILTELDNTDGSTAVLCADKCSVITKWENGSLSRNIYAADSASATRKWTLLAAVMSKASFDGQDIFVAYDRTNRQFTFEACSHEHTHTKTVTDEGHPSYEEIAGDDVNHRRVVTQTVSVVCDKCGRTVSSQDTTITSADEPHTYTDGICTKCGHLSPAQTPGFTLETDRDEVGMLEMITVNIEAPADSTAVRIWVDDYIYNVVPVNNGKAEVLWTAEEPGEHLMYARATTSQSGEDAPESAWTYCSNVLTVTATESDEDLCGFTFTPPENLEAVPRGQMLAVAVNAEDPTDRNVLEMKIVDESGIEYVSTRAVNVEFPYTLQLPTLMDYSEDDQDFCLQVRACGTESRWVSDEYPFTLTAGYAVFLHSNNDYDDKVFSQPVDPVKKSVTLVSRPFTEPGKHFIGWTTKDGESVYEDGAVVTEISEDLDLYALWETNDNRLSVDKVDMTYPKAMVNLWKGEGGKVSVTIWRETQGWAQDYHEDVRSINFTLGGCSEVLLQAEPYRGYAFAGWYIAEQLDAYAQTLQPVEFLDGNSIYSFEVSGEDEWKKVCAVFVRSDSFGEAAFTIPTSLHKIEAYAFEGIGAESVYVPDDCMEIGKGAFSKCENLLKIRLPKDCDIDDDAFAESGKVVIYAPAGGRTQEWAEDEEHGVVFREGK